MLAEEAGIFLGRGEQDILEDDSFIEFSNRYREWAGVRDRALNEYLLGTPRLFRCFLPYSTRVFRVAHQVLWYLDEVIVRDPLELLLAQLGEEIRPNTKANFLRGLRVLHLFRHSLESGYLLLAGKAVLPAMNPDPVPQAKALLANPGLVEELDRAVRFGLDRRSDDQERVWSLYQAPLDAEIIYGWHAELLAGSTTSASIVVGETLPLSSAEEISALLKTDVYEQVRHMYVREVHRTLHAIAQSAELGTAVLFDRRVDAAIATVATDPAIDPSKQAIAVGSLNLALPYLSGVPSDRLLELREAIPESFQEFRTRLGSVTQKAMKEDPEHADEVARLAADRELIPMVRELQAEMDAVCRRTRITGYGIPAATTIGTLIGASAGVGFLPLLPMLLGGMIAAVKAAADSAGTRARLKANPYYFVWQARQS